ncbi:alpha/beta fold hydrolase, partial [Piscinibacter sp.]|uniref:alpha/beta fold hydrolase n=1 Tax=Piscinibacter sp. TaxID=1903157 RepID=UPI002F429A82
YPWDQGFNFGPRSGVLERCHEQLDAIFQQHQRPVSLVGWSLGGIYAREVAKEMPDKVRCVITLGTPFTGHPRATNAWRVYEFLSGKSVHDPEVIEQVRHAPPVPTTSIYSRSDGIVAWRCSVNEEGPLTENIELYASHVGMGMNPLALYAIADRLAQDPAHWKPFDAAGARRWFYRTG